MPRSFGCLRADLAGALDALQRDAQLLVAGGLGELFDGVAIAIAAAEVHPAVDAGRIALQHLLDQADALEELAPVERRDQAQAADQVGHRRLFGSLMAALGADGVLDRLPARGERRIELAPQRRGRRAVFARALQQAGHEGGMDVGGETLGGRGAGFERARQPIGVLLMRAALGERVGANPQVFDQGELERARPRPELANRQRRDRLKGGDETMQPLGVETTAARPDQLERQRIDARQPRELVGGNPWQLPKERRRHVVVHVARGGRDDVEVVEQPLGRGRHAFAMGIVGERGVGVAKPAGVFGQTAKMRAPSPATAARQRQERGEMTRVLLEQFDSKQFKSASCERARRRRSLP